MQGDLEWHLKLPNEAYEEMELDASIKENGEESYRLFIPAYVEKGKVISTMQSITLTGPEFDQLAETVSKFRSMKGATV